MNPAALAWQLEQGIGDFLRMSFWSSTPTMEHVIDGLIERPGAIIKGPWVSLGLPFKKGSGGEFFPHIPLGFAAHKHQQRAFARLSGDNPQSTIVATGTGSGKTESFLWPILEHCRTKIGAPGIKAIIVYPMNALATDQAARIARAIHNTPALRGGVRAGLYIGESAGEKRSTHRGMGEDHIITDRTTLKRRPPDILLTNYKMLDYLLVRPQDQELWKDNADALRYLVVDELHTFDGAQGTDLACLIRRLKARLNAAESLCCIGTSATLGGGVNEGSRSELGPDEHGPDEPGRDEHCTGAANADEANTGAPASAELSGSDDGATTSTQKLRQYAQEIFGADFGPDSVVTEERISADEFAAANPILHTKTPRPADSESLNPLHFDSPEEYLRTQQSLWFDEPVDAPANSVPWRVKLARGLSAHATLHQMLMLLDGQPATIRDLVSGLVRSDSEVRGDPRIAYLHVVSFISLISAGLRSAHTDSEANAELDAAGARPFLDVRLQLWQREMRRMVADLGEAPTLQFSDDLTAEQQRHHLPVVHCRDCAAMGWATVQARDRTNIYRCGLTSFYRAFFTHDPQIRLLWPAAAAPADMSARAWKGALRCALDRQTLERVLEPEGRDDLAQVIISNSTTTENGRQKFDKDCPFCGAGDSLTLLGFRAATLTSVYIDQLFASAYNDDKKLLTFSDSVQDAAHRAGFFGARTWRFNLRVALRRVLEANEGASLEALPGLFADYWRNHSGIGAVQYCASFIAPNMEWLSEYNRMIDAGDNTPPARLLELIDKRIAFEIFTEFGHQARIGRSLVRTRCAAVYADAASIDAAVSDALERLQNEVGGLRGLQAETLRRLMVGALTHLRERGGIMHRELPEEYTKTGGSNVHAFTRAPQLPNFGKTSRLPSLLTNRKRAHRFESLLSGSNSSSWYERWMRRVFADTGALLPAPVDVWTIVLDALCRARVLERVEAKDEGVWGLKPAALRVSTKSVSLRCPLCRHWQVAAEEDAAEWDAMPCLSARCEGVYQREAHDSRYFGELYRRGEVERIFSAEHTGLLKRSAREEVELQFKADDSERKPWFANLLSCTPTLEMGIDIGALSSAIMCSVPPGQANYLQRIGRTGRRDGNSLLLTVAQGRPHDLYFYARPDEMLAGEVRPPGVFLNASAVLERQLAAFCLDCWNKAGTDVRAIPKQLSKVFENVAAGERFPHSWLRFVDANATVILENFSRLFEGHLSDSTKKHLQSFLIDGADTQGTLGWRLLDIITSEKRQRDSLRGNAKLVRSQKADLESVKARNKDHEDRVAELEKDLHALSQLIRSIDKRAVIEFLTDHGVLPNYAFPESPIRLQSMIWRRRGEPAGNAKGKYERLSWEYARPASAAISELAPDSRFFAGGRKVTIERVDLDSASIEEWRFCDMCSHSTRVVAEEQAKNCPACGSDVWGEDTQKSSVLRLTQVFANTSDKSARIRDDQEDRNPRHYNRHMLMSFADGDRDGAWAVDSDRMPFGFEYVRRASFREMNFGEYTDKGSKFMLAGREAARQGFVICKHCGSVQERARPGHEPEPKHTNWCLAKKSRSDEDFKAAIYLYREFHSEALRILLPLADIGTDEQQSSFMAAFQLGLRTRYGGRVDHLQTMVYSEPDSERDSVLRKQFLVLYDTVPGGTGYLKHLSRMPADPSEAHPLFEIIELALGRMSRCACIADPDADGCYRCLFAYRSSRDMASTSSRRARELFAAILAEKSKLKPIERLSDVSISGLMDSVLESRFIESMRRLRFGSEPVSVRSMVVRNKPGYGVNIGGVSWSVEQQLLLEAKDGFDPAVSIDFVFHPDDPAGGRLPIAVFTDGYQYHRDRIGRDMIQRMSLIDSGRYDVRSFTWDDVEVGLDRKVTEVPFGVHRQRAELASGLTTLARALPDLDARGAMAELDAGAIALFAQSLGPDRTQSDGPSFAAQLLVPRLRPAAAIDLAAWRDELQRCLPPAAQRSFNACDESWLYVHEPPSDESPTGIWAAAPRAALRPRLDPSEFRFAALLDDSDERRSEPGFKELWRGWLRLAHFYRNIGHGWFVCSSTVDSADYAAISDGRDSIEAMAEQPLGWRDLDIEPEFVDLVFALSHTAVPIPEVGLEITDHRGHTTDIEGELVWSGVKVAVIGADADYDAAAGRAAADEGWRLLTVKECGEGAEQLLKILVERGVK